MKKRLVLKPLAVSIFYGVFLILVLVGLSVSLKLSNEEADITYVSKAILDEYIPVVKNDEKILKPYVGEEVTIQTNYYDYQDESKQQGSIIYYENTYIQNTGINYTKKDKFDIVSILDGEVIDIKEDNLLGNTITIKHSNYLISIYSSVSDIKVKKGSKVLPGEVIAISGTSELLKEDYNLHFELYANGEVVNPELYYGKNLNEI